MNKFTFIRLGFSGLCRAVSYALSFIVVYTLVAAITNNVMVSTSVFLSLVGLVALLVLLYIGNIPVYGSTKEEIKASTPIAPHLTKNMFLVLVSTLTLFALLSVRFMSHSVVSDEEKSRAEKYLLSTDMDIEDTSLLDILPPVFTDKLFISANYIEAAYAYAEDTESVELKKSFDEATAVYDDLTGACSARNVICFITLYVTGILTAILRLRIDYVTRLKEVEKYENN